MLPPDRESSWRRPNFLTSVRQWPRQSGRPATENSPKIPRFESDHDHRSTRAGKFSDPKAL